MSFVPLKRIQETDFRAYVIANSEAIITVGDAVIPGATTSAGFVIGAKNTTGPIMGVVKAIVANGKPLEVNAVTVSSSNQTVAQTAVEIIWAHLDIEWLADLSAASGTTTNSGLIQQFNLSATLNGTLDESSTGVFSTQKQFASFGVSPISTSKVTGKFSSTKTF